MFFLRHGVDFVRKQPQRPDHLESGFMRLDYIIDVPALRGRKWTCEVFAILLDFGLTQGFGSADAASSRRYKMLTAPSGPMTAISAVG